MRTSARAGALARRSATRPLEDASRTRTRPVLRRGWHTLRHPSPASDPAPGSSPASDPEFDAHPQSVLAATQLRAACPAQIACGACSGRGTLCSRELPSSLRRLGARICADPSLSVRLVLTASQLRALCQAFPDPAQSQRNSKGCSAPPPSLLCTRLVRFAEFCKLRRAPRPERYWHHGGPRSAASARFAFGLQRLRGADRGGFGRGCLCGRRGRMA